MRDTEDGFQWIPPTWVNPSLIRLCLNVLANCSSSSRSLGSSKLGVSIRFGVDWLCGSVWIGVAAIVRVGVAGCWGRNRKVPTATRAPHPTRGWRRPQNSTEGTTHNSVRKADYEVKTTVKYATLQKKYLTTTQEEKNYIWAAQRPEYICLLTNPS